MIVTHEITMDLTKRGEVPFLEAVQDDKYSRNLAISLYSGSSAWNPPEGIRGVVRFQKEDGTGGEYDALPDGSNAFSVSGNVLTAALAPQVLVVPGIVHLEIGLFCADAELNSFQIILYVQPNMKGVLTESEDYYNVTRFVAQSGWAPNMYLGTDENGSVVAVEAPENEGVSEAQVTEIVAEYLTENPPDGVTEEEVQAVVAAYLAENPPEIASGEEIASAVSAYLDENPVTAGATKAQAAQIEQNTSDIAAIPVQVDEDGYTDISGLRQATNLSLVRADSTITVTTTLEGGATSVSVVTVDADGYPSKIVTDDLTCTVSWEGFDA